MTRPEQSKELGPSAPQTYGLSCCVSAQRAAWAALPAPTIGRSTRVARVPGRPASPSARLNRLLSTLVTSLVILSRLPPSSLTSCSTSSMRALAPALARSAAALALVTWLTASPCCCSSTYVVAARSRKVSGSLEVVNASTRPRPPVM